MFDKVGFPCGSAGQESICNEGDLSSIPESERSPREGNGYPLQYSGLKNSMDCIVHEEAKSWTKLSDFHFQRWDTDKNTTYISASFTQMLVIQSGL